MKKLFWVLSILIFGIAVTVSAQDFKRQYKNAKELFEDGNYSAAMDAFKALTIYDKENQYNEYASYYYAVSAYRLGYATVAKDMLLQIKKLYPQWNQLDEVNYLLSKIYFDQKDYFQARSIMNEVHDLSFIGDLRNLKQVYLNEVDDPETLRMMLEEYPDDVEIAKILVKRLGQQPYHLQDTTLINSLINQFGLSRSELIIENIVRPIKKDTFNVALIMPFMAATLEPSPVVKRNQFILEMYEGMKMAADTLSRSGVQLKLLAYDNERNQVVTKNLLKREEMKRVDLLVGPFFQEEAKLMQEFSLENHINLIVNPLSNSLDLVNKNPYGFLFQPSYETIGRSSADVAFNKARKKNCIVFLGETTKDSIMAANFIERANELDLKIVHQELVPKENSALILRKLATATEFDEWKNPLQFSLKKDSIGCIFVASANELIYSKVINSVETRKDSILVIGQEEWLDHTSIDLSKFERTQVVLASPNFKSIYNPLFINFRKKYIFEHGVLPSEYSAMGYEFIMTMGQVLNQFGSNFLLTMRESDIVSGSLGSGISFSQTLHDNRVIPFVSMRNGQLVRLE